MSLFCSSPYEYQRVVLLPAVVFPNQTALLQVVLGVLKPDRGEAAFQGRPLQEWESGAYRERLAWLNQVNGVLLLCVGGFALLALHGFFIVVVSLRDFSLSCR